MAFLLFFSCEKDAGTLGLDAIGEDPARAGVLSQFPVIAYSALEDSVLAVNPQHAIAGSYQDDVLGFSSSSFVTHLLLQSSQPDFGTDPQLDSVRMVLRYSGLLRGHKSSYEFAGAFARGIHGPGCRPGLLFIETVEDRSALGKFRSSSTPADGHRHTSGRPTGFTDRIPLGHRIFQGSHFR